MSTTDTEARSHSEGSDADASSVSYVTMSTSHTLTATRPLAPHVIIKTSVAKQVAIAAGSVAAAAASAVSLGSAGVLLQRCSVAVTLSTCDEQWSPDDGLSFGDSITQLVIGPSEEAGGPLRGALVGNVLVVVACATVSYAFEVGKTLVVFLQPSITAALGLLFNNVASPSGVDVLLSVVFCGVLMVLPCVVVAVCAAQHCWIVMRRFKCTVTKQ